MTEYSISLAVRALLSVGRAVIFDKLCSLKAQTDTVRGGGLIPVETCTGIVSLVGRGSLLPPIHRHDGIPEDE
jgi:hypothetical protein